jgi:hypothetical protein
MSDEILISCPHCNGESSVAANRSGQDLISALDAQRSFWAFVGIMAIVTIGLYLLGILILIAVRSAF